MVTEEQIQNYLELAKYGLTKEFVLSLAGLLECESFLYDDSKEPARNLFSLIKYRTKKTIETERLAGKYSYNDTCHNSFDMNVMSHLLDD